MTSFNLEWIAIILLSVGLIVTWVKNGRTQARKYGATETELINLKEAIDKQTEFYEKVTGTMVEMGKFCAGQTATFTQKIKNLEGEVSSKRKG